VRMKIQIQMEDIYKYICCLSIGVYVACAIAFEYMPGTAVFNKLAIYSAFGIGVLLIILNRSLKINIYAAGLYIMFSYIFLMSFVSGTTYSGSQVVYLYMTCAILCYVVYYITYMYPRALTFLIWGHVIGAVFLALEIVFLYGGFSSILEYASTSVYKRVGEGIINENVLGLYMGGAVLSIMRIVLKSKKKRLFLLSVLSPCLLLFTAMVLLTASKKAIIFLVISIFGMLWLNLREVGMARKIITVIFMGMMVLVLLQAIKTLPFFQTINTRLDEFMNALTGEDTVSKSDQTRALFIVEGWAAFERSPLFGNGTGHSYSLFGTYSHNNFIELLMNYGIIGFGVYYIPYIILIFKLYKRSKLNDINASFFLLYVVIQIVLGFAWVNYYERVVQVIAAAAWGYVQGCEERRGVYEN